MGKHKSCVVTVDDETISRIVNLTAASAVPTSEAAGPVGSLRCDAMVGALPRRPAIVCLCGSTRFHREFVAANYRETMAGKIVLSVGFYPHAANEIHGEGIGITPEQKEELDELHKRKIDLCDEVLVLNVGGYIGSSTRSEVAYARDHGKPIRWLESSAPPAVATESPNIRGVADGRASEPKSNP